MTYFEEYLVGAVRTSFGRTLTESDIVAHAGQTGDFYPHHMDAEFCLGQPSGQRIAHGTLVLSMAIGLLATDINVHAMSYGYDRVRFIKPVFIGDTIIARSETVRLRDHKSLPHLYGMVDELVSAQNQRGEIVLSLTKIYLVDRMPSG